MNQICDEHVIRLIVNAYRVGWIAAQGGIASSNFDDRAHARAAQFAREQLTRWKDGESNADCREHQP